MTLQLTQLELFGGLIRVQWASARISVVPPAPPKQPVAHAEEASARPSRPGLVKTAYRAPLQLVASK